MRELSHEAVKRLPKGATVYVTALQDGVTFIKSPGVLHNQDHSGRCVTFEFIIGRGNIGHGYPEAYNGTPFYWTIELEDRFNQNIGVEWVEFDEPEPPDFVPPKFFVRSKFQDDPELKEAFI